MFEPAFRTVYVEDFIPSLIMPFGCLRKSSVFTGQKETDNRPFLGHSVVEAISMKVLATLGTAVLVLSLGTIARAFAQHEQEEAKPEQKQAQPQQQRAQGPPPSQPQQEHAQQPNQDKPKQAAQQSQSSPPQQQQAKRESQNKPQLQQQSKQGVQRTAQHTQAQQQVQQAAWQGHRSQNWQSDHRTWQQRGGYNGYRIPENHYNGYFGPSHAFVIFSQPYTVVGGFPRFQYGGYWFSLVDPWPESWSNNWYETDDVYVAYVDNGYYMYNRRYPTVGIAITVSM